VAAKAKQVEDGEKKASQDKDLKGKPLNALLQRTKHTGTPANLKSTEDLKEE